MNLVTIVILSQGRCGLSKCVARYLVSMAVADLLVIIVDVILRQIPIAHATHFLFVRNIKLCNIHSVLLYAVTDCSVWYTVAFTFDRFVAICCQKLKAKYCTERTATIVVGSVTVLFLLKNTFWYFVLTSEYLLFNIPWFCNVLDTFVLSRVWGAVETIHYILTPFVPFFLILLLNALTVRHILVSSGARRRLRLHSSGKNPSDPEIEKRRKSIILLFVISGNFILLWVMFLVNSIYLRIIMMQDNASMSISDVLQEIGFMLQLLSSCTNTCIYVATQNKFRNELKSVLKYPITLILKCCWGNK